MPATIDELAKSCNAKILASSPEAHQVVILSAANNIEAGTGEITFIANRKHLCTLKNSSASAVIIPLGAITEPLPGNPCLLAVSDPEMAFIQCLYRLYPKKDNPAKISADARVDSYSTVGEGTTIEAFATVGASTHIGKNCWIHSGCRIAANVKIGDHCTLHPNVILYEGVVIGDHVTIHAGSVIGADGFGYKFRNGEHVKFPQVGTVEIESQVEIGANACIDRAALGATRIGKGSKLDNLVHIAHNVQIGSHVLLCGQVGIGGSTTIGDYAVLASQSGVADHVSVGEKAVVLAQSGVTKDILPNDHVMGFPAVNRREALQEMATLRKYVRQHKSISELVSMLPQLKEILPALEPDLSIHSE